MIKHLTKEDDFKEIVKNGKYLVDFYADWCGPCRMLAPILEEITEIEIIKINVDEFPELSSQFGVMSIPTLVILNQGIEQNKLIGFKNKEEIIKAIN